MGTSYKGLGVRPSFEAPYGYPPNPPPGHYHNVYPAPFQGGFQNPYPNAPGRGGFGGGGGGGAIGSPSKGGFTVKVGLGFRV